MMLLKAASVNNLTDARYFNVLDNAYIGLNFDALNPKNVTIEKATQLIEWLFEPLLVAEFGLHQTKEEMAFILNKFPFSGWQVDIEHPCSHEDFGIQKWLTINDKLAFFNAALTQSAYLIFSEGNVPPQHLECKAILTDIVLDEHTQAGMLTTLQADGWNLHLPLEERPGWSSIDLVNELLEHIGH